jgi:hypothetical protein
MLTFYMVHPLLGCFQLLIVFDVARFRCRSIWCFGLCIAWCGENCSTCATPCRSVNFCYMWATLLSWSRVGEFCSTCADPFRSVNLCCTWVTRECSLGIIGYLLDSVELVIWAFFLLSWLCFFKALYCTWLSIVYSHLFFSCCWFYLVFRYLRYAWAGVAHLLFTHHTTLFRWFTFIVTSWRFRELPI